MMSQIKRVEEFKVYQKARILFDDFTEKDLPILLKSFFGRTLAGG